MTNHNDRMRLQQAAEFLKIDRSTLYRLAERDPTFPRKTKLSERICFYRKSDLEAWLKSREV